MGVGSWEAMRRESCWQLAGTPVMGSRRVLRWAMDHEGEMRRSEDELGEVMSRGTSAELWRAMMEVNGWVDEGGGSTCEERGVCGGVMVMMVAVVVVFVLGRGMMILEGAMWEKKNPTATASNYNHYSYIYDYDYDYVL
jgi:hypothetical protein